jgi:glucosamine kinase
MSRTVTTRARAIGVDLGGTWVRALVLDGRRRRVLRAPVSRVPELRSFLLKLGPAAQCAALVVAARGVWTGRERGALRRRLRGAAATVRVLSDAEAAFRGALGDGPGLLILSGTGSIVIGRAASGRWARAGGLGPLLGDEGSAFWLGREWLRDAARRGDVRGPRRLARSPDAPRRIAALARRVLARGRAGDARAGTIVREGQRHLAAFASQVVAELRLAPPVAVAWAGGVMGDAWFRRGVARALARVGVRARWVRPAMEPVEAAARLAAQLASRRRGVARRRPSPTARARPRAGSGRSTASAG